MDSKASGKAAETAPSRGRTRLRRDGALVAPVERVELARPPLDLVAAPPRLGLEARRGGLLLLEVILEQRERAGEARVVRLGRERVGLEARELVLGACDREVLAVALVAQRCCCALFVLFVLFVAWLLQRVWR